MNIYIGPHTFKSKAAAKDHSRSIMERHPMHFPIIGPDDIFLRDLISIHPECEQKTGSGIKHFTSRIDPIWKTTRHFVIVRTDGSTTDFSFHTCIDGNNHRKDVLQALRHAISDQVVNFQRCSFALDGEIRCPYTGEILSASHCHVDHTPPDTFLSLVQRWWKQDGIEHWADIELVDNADNQWVRELKNEALSSSWQRFHISNCNLRLVSPIANLSHVKREMSK